MSLLGKLLGKKKVREIPDPDFGPFHHVKDGGRGRA